MSAYEMFVAKHGLVVGSAREKAFAGFATRAYGMHLYLLVRSELEALYTRFTA